MTKPTPPPLKPRAFQILLSLADRELHGSEIMEEVLERTDGHMKLWPGTLYGSLHDLDERGLIHEVDPPSSASVEGGRPRYYTITGAGRAALRAEVERMAGLVRTARRKRVVDGMEPV
jgi:DNA-binding PadR family transcriptional regulator